IGSCGTPGAVRTGLTTPLSVAYVGPYLLWASRSDSLDAGAHLVVASCTPGTCPTSATGFSIPIAPAGAGAGLWVGTGDVFWTDGASAVYRCAFPRCDGGAETLVSGRVKPASTIIADSAFVYFADAAGLWKIAR